jgi:hypothetical protein
VCARLHHVAILSALCSASAAVALTWSGNQVLLVVAAMALVACNVGVRQIVREAARL